MNSAGDFNDRQDFNSLGLMFKVHVHDDGRGPLWSVVCHNKRRPEPPLPVEFEIATEEAAVAEATRLAGLTEYWGMSGPLMLAACCDDATKWAAAFCEHAQRLGHPGIDEGWMISWFANAIEHSHDVRTGRGPTVMPDGSAFVVAG